MSNCISIEAHLAKFGISIQQANDFINSNLHKPEEIFQAARDYGVTTQMLNELSGYSMNDISEYFKTIDLEARDLDDPFILVNSDLNSLESLVSLNTREDTLSNTSLHAATIQKIHELFKNEPQKIPDKIDDYEVMFNLGPPRSYQDDDSIYDASELGVCNLASVPATPESLESLFNGSLINIFSVLDDNELNLINGFSNKNSEEYQALLISSLSTPSSAIRSDADIVSLITNETIRIVETYWDIGDVEDDLDGILDYSYLGLATI